MGTDNKELVSPLSPSHEDVVRRWPSANQEERDQICGHLDLGLVSF